MIEIRRYCSDMEDTWNEFCNKCRTPMFMFNRKYMDYHADRFIDHSLLFFESNRLVALFPANEKNDMLISHRGLTYGGLLISNEAKQHTIIDCIDELVKYCSHWGCRKVIYKAIPHVYHVQPSEDDLYALFRNRFQIKKIEASTVVDLKNPLKMPKGRKAQISRARREGAVVKKIEEKDAYKKFIELENSVLARHNTRAVHTSDELYLLHTRFPKNIHLYAGYLCEEMVAGSIIFEYSDVIHTQYMATTDRGREIGVLDLIIKIIMEEFSESKRWLDFGISTEKDGSFLNNGLISQKEGFGGRTNIYQTFELSIPLESQNMI